MPNKYSHAFVLSCYETKGFIDLQPRTPSPPAVSFSSPDLHAYPLNGRNSTEAPSLNAVPALSDSSTTSTASSSGEPPRQPSHSASSSIVTEIYAPQALSLESIPTAYVSPTEDPKEEDHSPTSPLAREPSPPPKKSRFSSFHDLSPFISRCSSPAKHHKRSPHRRSHLPIPASSKSTPPTSIPSSPIFYSTYQPRGVPTAIPPQQPSNHHTSHRKRLEPFFSNDSLDSLSLEDIQTEDEGRKSPNMDVLPWEYPETYDESPAMHQPHPPPKSTTQSTTIHSDTSHDSLPQSPNRSNNYRKSQQPAAPAIHYNSANQPIKYFPNASPSPSRFSPPPSTRTTRPPSPKPAPQPAKSRPIHTLPRYLSNESFDSAAPPPIRTTPRDRSSLTTVSR
ncbi:MAG: hypothetical protein Q9168_006933 [Polycauliona sp. 1 TL-2023]